MRNPRKIWSLRSHTTGEMSEKRRGIGEDRVRR
jgi:hypothetical protein